MNTTPASSSIFSKQVKPRYQALIAIGLLIFILAISKAIISPDDDQIFFWEASFAILMAFGLFNAVFSIPSVNRAIYFRNSVFFYVIVAAVGGFMATWFSGITLDESGSFRWLYVVFTFSYLVFISIINAMRKIMEMAKKQDARLRGDEPFNPRLN